MSDNTAYHFFSWTREGLSVFLKNSEISMQRRGQLDVKPIVKAKSVGSDVSEEIQFQSDKADKYPLSNIQLYGPGDILGFDPRIISRCTPQPDASTFEPNYFPAIEFADPDFAWRYTPIEPQLDKLRPEIMSKDKLQPWITLIVLAVESWEEPIVKEFDEDQSAKDQALPRAIRVNVSSLPDLDYVHYWAHVHLTDTESIQEGLLNDQIKGKAICRLLCPRRLSRRTRYAAFVVPTFLVGLKAGLGKDIANINGADPAWNYQADIGKEITLPYYYRWEFITGEEGDFEYLVDLLKPLKLTNLGIRPVDCSRPGFGVRGITRHEAQVPEGEQHCLGLEGALKSENTKNTPWGFDRPDVALPPEPFQSDLAALLPKEDEYLVMANFPTKSGLAATTVHFREGQTKEQLEINLRINLPGKVKLYYRKKGGLNYISIDAQSSLDKKEHWCSIGSLVFGSAYDFYLNVTLTGTVLLPGLIRTYASDEQVFTFPIIPTIVPPAYGRWYAGRSNVDKHCVVIKNTGMDIAQNRIKGRLLLEDEPIVGATIRLKNTTRSCVTQANGAFDLLLGKNYERVELEFPKPIKGVSQVSISHDKKTVDIQLNSRNWFSEINLDPRHRIAAGLGAGVIRAQQESLMASAWEQLGQYQEVNALRRNGQHGVEVLKRYHSRITPLIPTQISPIPPPSSTPQALTTTKRNKIRGDILMKPLTQRLSEEENIIASLEGNYVATDTPTRFVDPSIRRIIRKYRPYKRDIKNYSVILGNLVTGLIPTISTYTAVVLPGPGESISAWVESQVINFERDEHPVLINDNLKEILWSPSFDRAMYESLRDLEHEYLLPGLEKIPTNSIGLLSVNRRFIEAYMCGLNHEFGKELLWRGFPTDQRGTYFQKFWDYYSIASDNLNKTDVKKMTEWGGQLLSENGENNTDANPLVLFIRGDLLRRYPNARIYLAQYKKNASGKMDIVKELEPDFYATLPPDITFLGFNSVEAETCDYFIFEEHICEPRFGLDEKGPINIASWKDLSWTYFEPATPSETLKYLTFEKVLPEIGVYEWNLNSANQACITQQQPVKLVVPKKRMIPEEIF